MAALGSWSAIARHGHLTTSVLLDRFEVTGPERQALEARRRDGDAHAPRAWLGDSARERPDERCDVGPMPTGRYDAGRVVPSVERTHVLLGGSRTPIPLP